MSERATLIVIVINGWKGVHRAFQDGSIVEAVHL